VSRVVVVGAGVGGLAAAARLAAGGHRVTVCEQAPVVGGKLGLFERAGFRFDTGPSLLTMPYVLRDLFRETGDPVEQALDVVPLDPIASYRFSDGSALDVPADPGAFPAVLQAEFGRAAAADWERFWRRAGRIWATVRGPFLESPVTGPAGLARQFVHLRGVFTVTPWRSLHALAATELRDPRLVQLVDRYATYTGSDPRRAPAALAAVPYAEMAFGGWYVRGGLRRLADALLRRCEGLGVTVRTSTPVAQVELTGSRASGVRLRTGGRLPADVVVADVDATHLYRDLVGSPAARRALRALGKLTPSLSGFVLLLALRGRTAALGHHTVLFPADYAAEFDAVFGASARPVPDPTLYVSAPEDPVVRPDGCETWFVLVNAPRHGVGPGAVDWTARELVDAYADHLLDVLARRGLDVRGRLLFCEVRTPYDLERDTGAVGGAIYGSSSNGARAAFLRPANRSPVPGLFLVGGSAHPGGGLPLALLSAQITAGLIGPA
jgi:phytoene desaturase